MIFKPNYAMINPGAGFNWELVESKIITNQSTVKFENLNGDLDEQYFIEYELELTGTALLRSLSLKPEGNTSNQLYTEFYSYNSGHNNHQGTLLAMNVISHNTTVISRGHYELYAKSGVFRAGKGTFVNLMSSGAIISSSHIASSWNEAATNISFLDVYLTEGVFSGMINLYKVNRGG